jgi:hypothetical protein
MTATVETIGSILRAENHVIVERDSASVFDFLADGLNNTLWRPSVRSIALVEGEHARVGARYRQVLIGPGRRDIAGDYEITEAIRSSELRFRVIAGALRPTGRYSLSSRPDGTTVVSFSLEVEPRGAMHLLRGRIRRAMASEVEHIGSLRNLLEN